MNSLLKFEGKSPAASWTVAAACVGALVCVSASFAQTAVSDVESSTSSQPAAFVYVSYTPTGASANKIAAYSAAANGALTPVSGSPFVANVTNIVVNGKYLIGSTTSGLYMAAFLMEPNGALHYTKSTLVDTNEGQTCAAAAPLIFDHTGATVYRQVFAGGLCESTQYDSYGVEKSTGLLQYLGTSGTSFLYNDPLTFLANNKFAYGTRCVYYRTGYLDTFTGYQRGTSEVLAENGGITANTPNPATSGDFYCRSFTAADPANHVAMALQPISNSTDGPAQLAAYTADTSGNLTTTNTAANMPAVVVGIVSNLSMSPSGKLLAVAGLGGLEIFHFNGAAPMTHYTGALTTDSVDQMFWDNQNHLYAISAAAGKIYAYTVTPTAVSQAPGSPYTISSPANIIVQPK